MGDFLFRRPLIKLSGEALGGAAQSGIDLGFIESLAAEIAELSRAGVAPAIVVGGGNLFRGVSGASRGLDRVRADQMGMLGTVMNALALQDCFLANGVPASVYSGLPVPSI